MVELKTRDAVIMTLESLDRAASSFPVIPHLESISVDILPGPELALAF
jgi:hypothetical protein